MKGKNMTRHEAREVAFIVNFEKLFQSETSLEDIISLANESENYKVNQFAKMLIEGVNEKVEIIDPLIEKNLVGWAFDRISKVSMAVLRLAIFEILFCDDIPVRVSINEAIELTKKYSTAEDASFVNGVLGAVTKEIQK